MNEDLTFKKIEQAQDFLNYFEEELKKRSLENGKHRDGLNSYLRDKLEEFHDFLEIARSLDDQYEHALEKLSELRNKDGINANQTGADKDYSRLKIEYNNLEKNCKSLVSQRDHFKAELEKEKQKVEKIFNDDTLIKLYYSKDWKTVLKFYAFKKKYLSGDSPISKRINSFVNLFKSKNRHKYSRKVSPLNDKLQKNVDYSKVLTIPYQESPAVSIIIPVYNGWKMNYRCVKSIIEHTSSVTYEIIFADDCSTDETKNATDKIKNLVHIYNKTNLGFLLNCNHAAKSARGEFILFLNNDTEVMPNWLSPLVDLIKSDSSIGMVGSKLIYPDGRLQEAGGIIWNDASGWNYGKFQDANASEFNYVKEADYISGAAIMIRKNIWQELGGFDERYVPAYCEDSDIAFAIRSKGYKVMYQPLSEVVHFESVSHKKEEKVEAGKISISAVRILNQKKLFDKWKDVFTNEQFQNGQNVFHARDRSAGRKTILVIDHYVPEFDKDAGSKTVYQYLELLVSLDLNVKFLGDNFYQEEPYVTILQQMGIEVLYGPWYKENWKKWILENNEHFDYIFLNRPHTSLNYLSFLNQNTKAKILYYGHDLHFLRELRKYEIDKDPATLKSSDQWKSKEQFIYENSDFILTPSEDETTAIRQINPAYNVTTILPYFFKVPAQPVTDFGGRKNILFVGGFGHPPNTDGVLWFCNKVWPLVTAKIENIKFTIVGSKPTAEINSLQSKNIDVLGFVTDFDLKNIYRQSRIAVIPMRYGAGVKGKTVEAMYNGLPVVSTTIGLEGMPGIFDFMTPFNDADAFANEIIAIYNNESKLAEMSLQETTYINRHFTWNAAGNQIKKLLGI